MKKLIAILALMISSAAFAESILIFEEAASRGREIYRVDYNVNKKLNRAWIDITVAESFGDDTHYDDSRVLVKGLSYDPELNGVVYDLNGEKVLCGTFYNARWVIDYGMSFRPTGRCSLTTKNKTVEVDNGFEIYKVKMHQVFFNVE